MSSILQPMFFEDLTHGGEPNRKQHRVGFKRNVAAIDQRPAVIDSGKNDPLDMAFSFRPAYRVGEIEGNAVPCNSRRVNPVPGDAAGGIGQSDNLTPGLEQLIGHNKANIACAKNDNPLSRPDAVQVCQCLGSACAHDARKIPAFKGKGIFGGPGGDKNRIRFIMHDALANAHNNVVIKVNPNNHRVENDLHAQLPGPSEQPVSDAEASASGKVLP